MSKMLSDKNRQVSYHFDNSQMILKTTNIVFYYLIHDRFYSLFPVFIARLRSVDLLLVVLAMDDVDD